MPQNAIQARPATGADPRFLSVLAWNKRWTDRAACRALAQRALDLGSADDPACSPIAAASLRTLAWQAKWRGDFDATAAFCMRAKKRAGRTEARHVLAEIYSLLGVVHYSAGRRDIAAKVVRRGFDLLDASAPAETHVDLCVTRSTILRYRGRLTEAREVLETARAHAEGTEIARVDHNTARMLNHEGAYAEAAVMARASLDRAQAAGARVLLPYVHEVLGTALIRLGDLEEAAETLGLGLGYARADADLRAQCQILNQAGIAASRMNRPAEARDALTEGFALANRMGYSLWKRAFAVALGGLHEDQGDFRAATSAYKTALELQEKIRD